MRSNIILLLITICSLSSCSTMYNLRTINLEMLKPGLLALDKIDTIALFNRNFNDTINKIYSYKEAGNQNIITDSLLSYQDLSVDCLDALADFLDSSGYFSKVINFRDSLKVPESTDEMSIQSNVTSRINVDACIFLDYLDLKDKLLTDSYYFDSSVIFNFPEFRKSSIMESIKVKMIWSILLRGDSAYSTISKPDDIYYGNSINPDFFGSEQNHRNLIKNTAIYLGQSFGSSLIHSWNPVQRTFYKSHNSQMLVAEKHLLKGDYMKAAEIYSKFTKNKNPNIVAKATYNMALINELEGNTDAALDWITHSLSAFKRGNTLHSFNCIQYSEMLTIRKKELEELSK